LGATAITAELLDTPDVDIEQLESERKKITSENLRVLQKRFGERFVKGDFMEGGGYTGGAARELLAGFTDRPDFADKLKRLIPNRHGALKLLKDSLHSGNAREIIRRRTDLRKSAGKRPIRTGPKCWL
jgi:hypothetical protein